ncbi:hypothetical protein pb186bvf_018522 [Paramecium bursaria]
MKHQKQQKKICCQLFFFIQISKITAQNIYNKAFQIILLPKPFF